METTVNESLFNRDFIQNYITEYVSKALRVVPMMDYQETDADNYVWYKEDQSPEADITAGKMALPEKVASGAELLEVSTSGLTAQAQPVVMKGYKLRVENRKLKQNGQSILRFIKRLSYGMARVLEAQTVSALVAGASAPTASLKDGAWDDSTAIDIDAIRMQDAFDDDSLDLEMDTALLHSTNLREVREFLVRKGYTNVPREPTIEELQFKYGGRNMTEGYSIGFDSKNPPATVVYGFEPGAHNATALKGMEGYKPLINVKVKSIDDEIPAKTEIYMATISTVAVELGEGIQRQSGL